MAPPRQSNVRRRETSTGDFHELGVKGRKTGIELPDTGVRDEHGMQPIDGLFSSPEKDNRSASDDGEEDMELESESGPGPSTIMKNHPRLVPRGTSPRKTNLGSPAMRHPSFGPSSSPTRLSPQRRSSSPTEPQPTRGGPVSRKLDYGALEKNGPGLNGKRPNGFKSGRAVSSENEEDEEAVLQAHNGPVENGDEESMQMVSMDDGEVPEPESEPEAPEPEEISEVEAPKQPVKRKGRPAKAKPVVQEEAEEAAAQSSNESEQEKAPVKRRGRPAKGKGKDKSQADEPGPEQEKEPEPEVSAPKRRRSRNSNGDKEQEEEDDRASKRQRKEPKKATGGARGRPKAVPQEEEGESPKQTAKAASKSKPGPKGKPGRKPQATAGEDSILGVVQKGPPMPKARGLVSQKQKQDPHSITHTRSGRQSYRPLAFWKNEHVTYDEDGAFEDGKKGNRFLLPSVKEVVRVEEEEREAARKGKSRGRRPTAKAGRRRQQVESEDEEPAEPWEQDPGSVDGEIVVWQPEHEFNPPAINEQVEIDEERIAVAASAIQTRDIRDATFRFAKTLSLPFFGSGVVDLPPGAEKRPKNSRKMQMVFFVFQGKVLVMVHESQFRISAGGMWFVPRGNYYSIHNDYENPARIFFAQGCELSSAAAIGGTPGFSQDTTIG
ncbi:cupin [Colletotrichum orchidophilum]|uniref:CENP-C homolog n=1 Tax=Colletotrichum orchidophilum TaxID=1209926 RepID=A0A1G4BCP5_9PEZI|nr:cupin [Colletotrichum orchidophilum]OHE99199.1 cupin [Colletotrichum orchidophilum]